MTVEYSTAIAHKAVDLLHREALAQQVPYCKQEHVIGLRKQAIGTRWKRQDMKLTEFCRMADALGRDPSQLLKEAEKQKKPSVAAEGNETERK